MIKKDMTKGKAWPDEQDWWISIEEINIELDHVKKAYDSPEDFYEIFFG